MTLSRSLSTAQPTVPAASPWRWAAIGAGLLLAAGAGALVMRGFERAAPVALTQAPSDASPAAPAGALAAPAAQAAAVPHRAAHAVRPSATGAVAAEVAPPTPAATPVATCADCGVVESVQTVQHKGAGTGLGAVAGGLLGGVVGHQMGGGNGRTAMTVLGAVGGGMAGNEVEKRARAETVFQVRVRMDDGTLRTFERAQSLPVGASVVVAGQTLHLKQTEPARPSTDAPRTLRTSTAAGTS